MGALGAEDIGSSTAAPNTSPSSSKAPALSVVMPCLNEAKTVGACIAQARAMFAGAGIDGEVVIGDNGSTDGSQDIARAAVAADVDGDVDVRGYGAALMGAIENARAPIVIMGDADMSYDFGHAPRFVDAINGGGFDLVMGNRFRGGIEKGAMPPLHRYLGTPCSPPWAASFTAPGRWATFIVACGPFAPTPSRGWGSAARGWSSPPRWS